MTGVRAVGTLFLAVAMAACSDADSADGFVVRDSAGVRIAESRAPSWSEAEAWTIDATPSLRIGTLDGAPEYLFQFIRRVLRLDDGRIVVADAATSELRWYDPDGSHAIAAGGRGGGPGEFALLGDAFAAGDSVIALDVQYSTLLFFAPSGEYVRTVRFEWPTQFAPPPVGRLPDGSWITHGYVEQPGEQLGRVAYTDRLYRFGPDGALLDTLATFPSDEAYLTRCGPENRGICNNAPVFGLAGSRAVADTLVYVGNGNGYDIRLHDTRSPRMLGRIRRIVERVPVRDADVSRYVESLLERYPPERQPEMRRTLEEIPAADSIPSYRALHVDDGGMLWVERYRVPWDPGTPVFDMFDTDGRWLGEVNAPTGLDVHQIGDDFVLGVTRDENDVQYVVMHRLIKRP
jgi:hypothetical protein